MRLNHEKHLFVAVSVSVLLFAAASDSPPAATNSWLSCLLRGLILTTIERAVWPLVFTLESVIEGLVKGSLKEGRVHTVQYLLSTCFYLAGNTPFALQIELYLVGQGLVKESILGICWSGVDQEIFIFVDQELVKSAKKTIQ